MARYIGQRLLSGLLQAVLVCIIVFVLVRVMGDPTDLMLPAWAPPDARLALRHSLGLDRPLIVQFAYFVQHAAGGDFGMSLMSRSPVGELLGDRLGNSVKLAAFALALALAWSVPLGVIAAVRRGGALDAIGGAVAVLGLSMPSFLLGFLLIFVFALRLPLLPTSGIGGPQYYVLPGITLSAFLGASVMRLVRTGMLDVMQRPYVTYARAKGLGQRRVVWTHAFRNATIVLVTFAGMQFGLLVGGSVVVESVFAWPGLGRMTYQAVLSRDYPVIQAVVLALGISMVVVNLIVDVLYGYLDPLVRHRRYGG